MVTAYTTDHRQLAFLASLASAFESQVDYYASPKRCILMPPMP